MSDRNPMIVRIYRGVVFPGKEQTWQSRVEELSIPWLKSLRGLVAFYPGRPMLESGNRTFCMVMVFESIEMIAAVFGEHWRRPAFLGDEAEFIETSQLEHYELYGNP